MSFFQFSQDRAKAVLHFPREYASFSILLKQGETRASERENDQVLILDKNQNILIEESNQPKRKKSHRLYVFKLSLIL